MTKQKSKVTTISLSELHTRVLKDYVGLRGLTSSGWIKRQIETLPEFQKELEKLENKIELEKLENKEG
jgi:hypothetical protein